MEYQPWEEFLSSAENKERKKEKKPAIKNNSGVLTSVTFVTVPTLPLGRFDLVVGQAIPALRKVVPQHRYSERDKTESYFGWW